MKIARRSTGRENRKEMKGRSNILHVVFGVSKKNDLYQKRWQNISFRLPRTDAMWHDCLFAFRSLISGVLRVRTVGQPLNENQSRRHKPLSQVCHGFVEVQSLVAKIESALWSQLSPKISTQFNGQFFVDCRQWFKNFLWYCLVTFWDRSGNLVPSSQPIR